MPLTDFLSAIEKQYQVRFVYKHTDIQHKVVFSRPLNKNVPVEKLLKEVLEPIGLLAKHTGSKYYSILQAPNYWSQSLMQEQETLFSIAAVVYDSVSKLPLPYTNITLEELGLKTQTNTEGKFIFSKIPTGTYTIQVQRIGYEAGRSRLETKPTSSPTTDSIVMRLANLNLEEIAVTARENQEGGEATRSTIDRMAIDHVQATSLADVMQLLPGKLAQNPALTSVNKVSLREINTSNSGSLGTALLINGVPISNNANMQFSNSATGGVNASFATTAGAGVDFRQLSADNIESVEVIRGIPSVRYGDLTSGAIIVKTRVGEMPLEIKTRVNPTLRQFFAGKGFALPHNSGVVNIDLDYTRAVSDQRYSSQTFNRYTSNLVHEKIVGTDATFRLQTGFSYSANIGQKKVDPNDVSVISNKASDYSYRLYQNGTWETKRKFSRQLTYTVSLDYTHQKGFQESLESGGFPIVYAMENGLNEATLVNGVYQSQLWIDGKPLNFFARVNNEFFLHMGPTQHRILMGAEWRTNDNFGDGKIYAEDTPPSLATGVGTRPRSYKSIPGLHQLSLYAEDKISIPLAQRMLDIQLGLRYDNIQPRYIFDSRFAQVLSPRINASYDLSKQLRIRAGYGLAAKSPTLAYLYPQNAYFDAISLNHTSENVAERLVLVSTYVFPTVNEDLKMAVNHKKELGFTWHKNKQRIQVTGYHERTINAYDYQDDLSSYQILNVPLYSVTSRPEGSKPVVSESPTAYNNYFVSFQRPTNGRELTNKGIEFDVDFGRIDALNTSIVINGAWMNSKSTQQTFYMLKKSVISSQQRQRVGIYPAGRGKEDERLNSTIRLIHHIPSFRLIATLTAQTTWIDKNKYLGYEKNAIGYLSLSDGSVNWLSEAEREALAPETDEDIILDIADAYYITESWKPLWLFNFRLTKELSRNVQFSFFANNIFKHRPIESSNRYTNVYSQRNPALFFGLELQMKLF